MTKNGDDPKGIPVTGFSDDSYPREMPKLRTELPHHSSHRHTISKEEITALPLKSYTGSIHVIDSDEKMSAAARALRAEKVLGFDTETRPAFKAGESYPPALVQLAGSGRVYIFQMRHLTSYGPLAAILADKQALKAGVAVRDDLKNLGAMFSFKPAGFVELADMSSELGIKNSGVRGLAALLFGFRISKREKISRWDALKLTKEQIAYAATDAWICREIYFALKERSANAPNKTGRSRGNPDSS
jgi:ribonuclease D